MRAKPERRDPRTAGHCFRATCSRCGPGARRGDMIDAGRLLARPRRRGSGRDCRDWRRAGGSRSRYGPPAALLARARARRQEPVRAAIAPRQSRQSRPDSSPRGLAAGGRRRSGPPRWQLSAPRACARMQWPSRSSPAVPALGPAWSGPCAHPRPCRPCGSPVEAVSGYRNPALTPARADRSAAPTSISSRSIWFPLRPTTRRQLVRANLPMHSRTGMRPGVGLGFYTYNPLHIDTRKLPPLGLGRPGRERSPCGRARARRRPRSTAFCPRRRQCLSRRPAGVTTPTAPVPLPRPIRGWRCLSRRPPPAAPPRRPALAASGRSRRSSRNKASRRRRRASRRTGADSPRPATFSQTLLKRLLDGCRMTGLTEYVVVGF